MPIARLGTLGQYWSKTALGGAPDRRTGAQVVIGTLDGAVAILNLHWSRYDSVLPVKLNEAQRLA